MKRLIFTLLLSASLTACESMPDMKMPEWSALNPFRGEATRNAETATSTSNETAAQTANAVAPVSSTATSTEMAEMEYLTGSAPRFDTVQTAQTAEPIFEPMPEAEVESVTATSLNPDQAYYETTAVEETTTPIEDSQLPVTEERVAEINAAIERDLAPKPVPQTKPAQPQKVVVVADQDITPAVNPETSNAPVPLQNQPQMARVEETPPMAPTPTPAPVAEPVQIQPTPAPTPVPAPAPAVAAPITQPSPASVQNTAASNDTAMFNEGELVMTRQDGCPMVEIMPSARSITYFENEMSGQMVARAAITEIRGGCEYKNGGMEIDLDILMKGKISKLGRFEGKEDMEAFMTFPYFVAVSTPQGLPVDKQILATAMQFKPLINDLNHAEKITQFIPLPNPKEGANYKIQVGFQLNRKQLQYNRAVNLNRVDNDFVAPDMRGQTRVSQDPLAQ